LKDVRLLNDSKLISTAGRTILSCYGVAGGMAGGTYKTIINGFSHNMAKSRLSLTLRYWWRSREG
jgi:hypothetical protein